MRRNTPKFRQNLTILCGHNKIQLCVKRPFSWGNFGTHNKTTFLKSLRKGFTKRGKISPPLKEGRKNLLKRGPGGAPHHQTTFKRGSGAGGTPNPPRGTGHIKLSRGSLNGLPTGENPTTRGGGESLGVEKNPSRAPTDPPRKKGVHPPTQGNRKSSGGRDPPPREMFSGRKNTVGEKPHPARR